MNQKEYWNRVASTKEFTTPFQMPLFQSYVRKDARICDVGCGYGRTLQELHQEGFTQCTGLDFSEEMIQQGLERYPHLEMEVMEKGRLPFPDQSLDAVLLLAVLTCIVRDDEIQELLDEITRVLTDQGVIYINDFLLNTDDRNFERYKQFEFRHKQYGVFELEEGAVLRHFSMDQIKLYTRRFSSIVFEQTVYPTMNSNTSNGFYYIGRKKPLAARP